MTILVVLSDTYDGLFATSGQIDVDVLFVESTKRDLDEGENRMVEDELTLTLSAASASNTGDQDAIAFVLDARDESVRRYVAVFLQPADVDAPTIDELDYSGLVRPEMSADDVQWEGDEWGDAPTPLREWKVTVKNLFEGVLDRISMHDLIYGHGTSGDPDYVPALDPAWIAANVAEQFAYSNQGNWEARWQHIVCLNTLLRALADSVEWTLDYQGYGSYEFEFADSPLGVKAAPAEFVDHYVATALRDAANPYTIQWLREKQIALGDSVGLANRLWISYGRVRPDAVLNLPGIDGAQYAFEKFETFADLLYQLALALGCYLQIEFVTATHLRITFLPRAAVVGEEIWIRDVTSGSLDVGPEQSEESDRASGFAHTLASEGTSDTKGCNHYEHGPSGLSWVPSQLTREEQDKGGEPLQFTIAPTMRHVKSYGQAGPGWAGTAMPHNVKLYKSSAYQGGEERDSTGVTTALWMNGHLLGGTHLMPVAALRLEIGGTPTVFYSLHEYVNALSGRDRLFYKTEYELRLPFVCSFRRSADGSHVDDDGGRGSWKNVRLGRYLTIDGTQFVIVGYERSYAAMETSLRLQHIGRFAFGEDTSSLTGDPATTSASAPAPPQYEEYECGEDIDAGDAVSLYAGGVIRRTVALRSHYGRYVGVAVASGLSGERIRVQTGGLASNAAWSLTAGAAVYVRTAALGTPNVSATMLESIGATEDMYVRIGVAASASEFEMRSAVEFVYAPGLPV